MKEVKYYKGYAIMFNPISSMYYFYTGEYTSNRKLVFDTFSGAIENINNRTDKLNRSK